MMSCRLRRVLSPLEYYSKETKLRYTPSISQHEELSQLSYYAEINTTTTVQEPFQLARFVKIMSLEIVRLSAYFFNKRLKSVEQPVTPI